jgi:hypothetical protein
MAGSTMKHFNVADTVVHRAALEQFLAESAADSLLAATTVIVQCDRAVESPPPLAEMKSPARRDRVDRAAANDAAADADRRSPEASACAERPQRFDVAHDQLYDYVDQRARRLVRIDENTFDGLASTSQ